MTSTCDGWLGPTGLIFPEFLVCMFLLRLVPRNPQHLLSHLGKQRQSLGVSSNTSNTATWLLFNGLDTFADISFCGEFVSKTDNQFRQYYFDISEIAARCTSTTNPELRVDFTSAVSMAEYLNSLPGQETWPWYVEGRHEFAHRMYIRKEQSDFGWDWGPGFAPTGIWQEAWVLQLDQVPVSQVAVRNSVFDVYRKGQLNNLPQDQSADWILNASIDSLNTVPHGTSMHYKISKGCRVISRGSLMNVTNTGDTITGLAVLNPNDYDLWWPVGMGQQSLYNITVELISADSQSLVNVTKRTGFRTIVLNMEPVSDEQIARGIAPGNNCTSFSISIALHCDS